MEETKETKKKTTTKKVAPKATTTKKTTTKKKTTVAKAPTKKEVKENVAPNEEKININTQETVHEVDAFAAISLVLGAASLITWLYPILGVAIAIPGLSIGIVTHQTRKSNYSLLGIVMSLVGIILSIIKAFNA